MILTLVNLFHQSQSDETDMMSCRAHWSVYISLTARTGAGVNPDGSDVIHHNAVGFS